jgi:hypothetical protein
LQFSGSFDTGILFFLLSLGVEVLFVFDDFGVSVFWEDFISFFSLESLCFLFADSC